MTILERLDGVDVVAAVGDGEAAVNEHGADVVLMDLRLPGMSGLEATRLITRHSPPTAVLELTMSEDDDSVFAALRAGAREVWRGGSAWTPNAIEADLAPFCGRQLFADPRPVCHLPRRGPSRGALPGL